MDYKKLPCSEKEELASFLAGLEASPRIRTTDGLDSGFPGLTEALNGFSPGLYFLIGAPSSGKTTLVKQLCDQVVLGNGVPVLFFSLAENKKTLRLRTLARLSGLESREIVRGSAFVFHRYGVAKATNSDPDLLPPGWEKLRLAAEQAKDWLDLVFLFDRQEAAGAEAIREQAKRIGDIKGAERMMIFVDDSQRLALPSLPCDDRLPLVAEQLQSIALELNAPVLATWPDLRRGESLHRPLSWEWGERIAGAEAVLVLETDTERTKKLTPPSRGIALRVVTNRSGEKGAVYFEFQAAASRFIELASDSAS